MHVFFFRAGILICSVAGMALNWWQLEMFSMLLPLTFTTFVYFCLPETPHWYISKGKVRQARDSLLWLRRGRLDVSKELNAIEEAHIASKKERISKMELFHRKNFNPLMIALGLRVFQQTSGIIAVISYTHQIFEVR